MNTFKCYNLLLLVAQFFRHFAASRKVVVSFPVVSLEFFVEIILLAVIWSWDQLSL